MYSCLSHDVVTCDVDRDVSTACTARVHQAMGSTGYASPFKQECSAVMG